MADNKIEVRDNRKTVTTGSVKRVEVIESKQKGKDGKPVRVKRRLIKER